MVAIPLEEGFDKANKGRGSLHKQGCREDK